MVATNITLDSGGPNEHTVYTIRIEEIISKKLEVLPIPQTSANWNQGKKDTKIVDLLRIEDRFNIDGYIDYTSRSKLWNLFGAGGVFKMLYNGNSYYCNFEKLTITEVPEDKDTAEPRYYQVKFTTVIGEDL